MSRKFKVWCDSGANSQSCRWDYITLSELNIEPEEWDAMTDEEKDEEMRDVAFQRLDWGYEEVK